MEKKTTKAFYYTSIFCLLLLSSCVTSSNYTEMEREIKNIESFANFQGEMETDAGSKLRQTFEIVFKDGGCRADYRERYFLDGELTRSVDTAFALADVEKILKKNVGVQLKSKGGKPMVDAKERFYPASPKFPSLVRESNTDAIFNFYKCSKESCSSTGRNFDGFLIYKLGNADDWFESIASDFKSLISHCDS